VARVEEIYWDYILAQRQIEIFENSLKLAEQQLAETREIIKVGKLAETEMVAAQAEIALRRQELIEAQNAMAVTRLRLLRLLNPSGPGIWERELILLNQPLVPQVELDDVAAHVKVALRLRPDLNQARSEIQHGDLQVVKTKNGLLPRMDLFISLGKTGYADSFGSALSNITDDNYDLLVGLRFEYPFRNREPRARHERAVLTQRQAQESLNNLSQLVELDVRTAYIELNRTEQQIHASKATRQLEEEKVRIETEKFRVGRSISFLVAQAQRDLVRAQIFEIRAVVNYLKALVDLHRVEGSLLERWGIDAPGKEPVDIPMK
jgi:outer membrane protein TolC